MSYLKEIIKFRISLLRERFSIYGISNIIVFFALASTLLVGIKIGIHLINNYLNTALLTISFLFCFVLGIIYPSEKSKDQLLTLQLFDKLSVNHYEKYLKYNKLIYFVLALLYLLFPMRTSEWNYFSIFIFIMHVFIIITTVIWHYFDQNVFNSFRWISSFFICIALFAISKYHSITKIFCIEFSFKISLLFLSLSALLFIFTIKLFSKNIKKTDKSYTHNFLIPFSKNLNKDYIYTLRSNILLEPTLVMIISSVISFTVRESFKDTVITHLFSFSYLLTEIYFALLKYENERYLIIPPQNPFNFKMQKVKHTIVVSMSLSSILILPLSLITSFKAVIISCIISVILFLVNSVFFRIDLEKKTGYRKVITDKSQMLFLLLFSLEIIFFSFI